MRVAVVLEQCLAPVPGGTGRYSREIALALAAQAPAGASVEGVTAFHRRPAHGPAGPAAGPPSMSDLPFPVRRLALPRRALVAAWERGLPPRVRADVVHAPTPLHPSVHPRSPLHAGSRRIAGDRPALVVTVHDAVPWTHPQMLTPRGVRWHKAMVGRAAATADLIVVPTHAVAEELARHVPVRDLLVVGEGVSADLALPADAQRRAARLGLPDRYLLTVATLEPRKGLAELVTALAEVPGIPLLCVGQPGWGGLSVEDVASRHGVDVRVLGHVPDADLAVLLAHATALVVPSYAEGFGLQLLEGMAAGVPVLTSDAAALVEVAGGAALAVPLGHLVDGLRQILGDEALRSRLRVDGPARAATYTWQAAAEQLWRAYANLHERDA